MGRVARYAPLCLDHRMLEEKWTSRLCVAFGADSILICRRLQLLGLKRPVRIMAVAAGHQTFIHFVVKGLRKGRFDIRMAGVAELRLRGLEQVRLIFEGVYAVATRATHSGLTVSRSFEVGVSSCVAAKA